MATDKKILIYGLAMLCTILFGLDDVSAQQTNIGTTENQNKTVTVAPGASLGRTSDGNAVVFPEGGSLGRTSDGRTVMRQSPPPQSYSSPNSYQQIDEEIKKDPTNAKLYLIKTDAMIRSHASPQEKIDFLRRVVELYNDGRLKATENDMEMFYINLGNIYVDIDRSSALYYYRLALRLSPDSKSLRENIDYLEKNTKK